VENSINHGFQDYDHPMNIVMEGEWTEEGEIVIRVKDDGVGMTRDKQTELNALLEEAGSDKYKLDETQTAESNGHGIGLKNIAERIKLHYGDQYYLRILGATERGRGTTIELLIPKR
jgi:two-component system sensor histidine kinase YesM